LNFHFVKHYTVLELDDDTHELIIPQCTT